MKVFKLTSGNLTCYSECFGYLLNLLEEKEAYILHNEDSYTLTGVEMTEEEYKNLEPFEGF